MLQAGTITMAEQITDITQMIIMAWGAIRLRESWDVFIGLKMV
jgi:hypothetical protein